MNKKIHSLALLVNLGIYGVAQAQEPTDTPVSHDRRLAFRPSPQMKSAKTPLPAMCRRSSVPCQALT